MRYMRYISNYKGDNSGIFSALLEKGKMSSLFSTILEEADKYI
jgi:hypothetical protein